MFILLGMEKIKRKGWFNDGGRILVPRALNDTKKIRKAGAVMFANFGLEKPRNNFKKIKKNRTDVSSIFP